MSSCSECGKKLRLYEGYSHPLRGKSVVCRACFEYITQGIEFYNTCLFKGRENHKKECYFWDAQTKRCRNDAYFQTRKKKKETKEKILKKGRKHAIENTNSS